MSVCFFVPADTSGASTSAEDGQESEQVSEESRAADSMDHQLQAFWSSVTADVRSSTADHFKSQTLPLARIKKIMKLDEEVKMISAEAPVLFAKAAEIFIHELTLRAWAHTEDNKRRTLQRNDIAMAISKSDQFDFLIDIVPRHEVKATRARDEPAPARPAGHSEQQYYVQVNQPQQQSSQQNSTPQPQQQIVLQPYAQMQQTASTATSGTPAASGAQQPVTIVQQLCAQQGDTHQMPIQLSQAQLNMIRLQMQNNPNQPIIIQAQQQQPQIIQVSSQAPQPQQQVYLAQVASSQDNDS